MKDENGESKPKRGEQKERSGPMPVVPEARQQQTGGRIADDHDGQEPHKRQPRDPFESLPRQTRKLREDKISAFDALCAR